MAKKQQSKEAATNFFVRMRAHAPLIFAFLVFLFLTITNPFSQKHVLYNLEPYPDGLFYVQSALNFAQHGQFKVTYNDFDLRPRITPVYSLLLAVGYFFNPSAPTFYWTNVVIGLTTIFFLYLTLQTLLKKKILVWLGLFIYLTHAYIFWLPSVPMAENAALLVFTVCLYGVAAMEKIEKNKVERSSNILLLIVIISTAIAALVLTKYTLVGVAGVFGFYLLYLLWQKKYWGELKMSLAIFIGMAVIFALYQMSIGFNPLSVLSPKVFNQPSVVTQIVFYSFKFMPRNTISYLKALVGFHQPFLWLSYSFTTIGLLTIFLFGNIFLTVRKKDLTGALWLLLFLNQFSLLLIFYVMDVRYIILTIPLFAVGVPYVLEKLPSLKWLLIVVGASLALQLVTQLSFFKYLIATNLLNKSMGWQYQAVLVLNQTVGSRSVASYPNQKIDVITALPPLFVDLYSNHQYALLPLSPQQEFVDKKQYLWGSDINYADLQQTYHQRISQGDVVLVSNAYLTSKYEFEGEFKDLAKEFTVAEVQEGCLGTCNVYRLGEK